MTALTVPADTEVMVRRADPVAVIWAEAPLALRFLTEDWRFTGPERTAAGIAYHRPGLHVEICFWAWKNECGFYHDADAGRSGWEATEGKSWRPVCGQWPRPCQRPPRALARYTSYASASASTALRCDRSWHPLTQATRTRCSRPAAASTHYLAPSDALPRPSVAFTNRSGRNALSWRRQRPRDRVGDAIVAR